MIGAKLMMKHQQWLRQWFGSIRHQATTCTNVDLVQCCCSVHRPQRVCKHISPKIHLSFEPIKIALGYYDFMIASSNVSCNVCIWNENNLPCLTANLELWSNIISLITWLAVHCFSSVHCTQCIVQIQCTRESRRLRSPPPFLVNIVNRYFVTYAAMKYATFYWNNFSWLPVI